MNKTLNTKQTAKLGIGVVSGSALSPVEWLEKEVKKRFGGETFTSVFSTEFEKAKQMEKDLSIADVSRSANTDEYTKGYRDGWRDCCKDQKEFG